MTFSAFLFQALNGLSTATGLFFIAVGLSLIFGVSRIINIAHGSLYMLGTYIAYSFATRIGGALGFWGGIVATTLIVGALGALIEVLLLRRVYRAPELFQLLATFALVLIVNDAVCGCGARKICLGRARRACADRSKYLAVFCRLTICSVIIARCSCLPYISRSRERASADWCGPQHRIAKW